MKTKRHQQGFTLIEIMIAMILGLFLTAGLIQIFQGSKKSYSFTEELARMQENGRYALDLLAYDIRMIGYQGCADPETVVTNVIADPRPASSTSVTGLEGFKVSSSGTITPSALPAVYTDTSATDPVENNIFEAVDVSAYVLPNTDMILMQFMNPYGANIVNTKTHATAQLNMDSNPNNFKKGDVVIVSDCETADIFRISNTVSGSTPYNLAHGSGVNSGTTTPKLSKIYGSDALILRFETNLYFIAPSGLDKDLTLNRTNKRGDTINSLYRVNIDNELDELVQGVDALILLYGERLSDGNVHYMAADDAGLDMARVDSIKVGLLMSSIEGITEAADTRTYNVAGTNFDDTTAPTYADDRRLRRVFSTTVNLRNRR